jgi:LuxR family transcriptional regulator, quorum-sensing system regulator BjaR1
LSGVAFSHFQTVLDAVEAFEQSDSQAALRARLAAVIAAFGFEHFCYAAPPSGSRPKFGDGILLNAWPAGWFEHYRDANLHLHDPVTRFTRKQTRSFLWSEAPVAADDAIAKSVMQIAAADYRLRAGLCVPIHGLAGYQASISFAGAEIDDRIEARSSMEIIAIYAVNKCNQLRADATPRRVLTAREREVMAWVAAGKTAWDIGCILVISEDTVNKLVASAMRRLNACNRPQAVAEAIRQGEIAP